MSQIPFDNSEGFEGFVPEGYWDSKPGDVFALDADLTLYWPWVRPCWEENAL